jgi:hypothetical protein
VQPFLSKPSSVFYRRLEAASLAAIVAKHRKRAIGAPTDQRFAHAGRVGGGPSRHPTVLHCVVNIIYIVTSW